MKSLSKYNITLARKINLPDFLVGHGYQLTDEGSGNYRVKNFQGLIVKEHYWYRHSTKEYGNAIDFIMKFEDRTFYNAVSRLLNIQPSHDLLSWQFLEKTTDLVKNYLIEARKIDSDIVYQLISQNKIKQDRANCICFLGYDDNDRLAYIFRRSINSEKTFKGEVKHSSKEHSFQIIIKNNLILPEEKSPKIKTLYIVEGAIDACALATLLKIKGKKDELVKIITTAGNPHHSLKSRIENSKPDKIIIATDMDEQGRKFTQIIETMIGMTEWSAPIYDAKDPSDLLQKIKGKSCV